MYVFVLLLGLVSLAAGSDSCYDILKSSQKTALVDNSSPTPAQQFLWCGVCNTQPFRLFADNEGLGQSCSQPEKLTAAEIGDKAMVIVNAFARSQGYFWLDDAGGPEANATQCLSYLLQHMPARDTMLLLTQPVLMVDFLTEHIRYSLQTRARSASMAFVSRLPWDIFLDSVLPYAVIDEKRDLTFRWKPRMTQLFSAAISEISPQNVSDIVRELAKLIPKADLQGALAMGGGSGVVMNVGSPVTWRSSTAPGFLSVEQVVSLGGSCTGTGIVLVAACRAMGVAARLAGCSESVVAGDDHHWIEFYDDSHRSPLGDFWHTREGVSAGNPDGPWDAASEPMNNCLRGVTPHDRMHTIWASSWASKDEMPMLWDNSSKSAITGHIGGVNRCGAYCSAWGCGLKQDQHWTEDECY